MTVVQVNAVGPDGCVSQHDSRCLAPGKPSELNLWKSGTVVEGPDVVSAMCAAHCAAWHDERRRGCACPLRSWNTSERQRPSRFGRGRRTCSLRGQGSKLMGTLADLRRNFDCAGDVEDTSILCPGARCRFPKASGRSVGMPSQAAILPTPPIRVVESIRAMAALTRRRRIRSPWRTSSAKAGPCKIFASACAGEAMRFPGALLHRRPIRFQPPVIQDDRTFRPASGASAESTISAPYSPRATCSQERRWA